MKSYERSFNTANYIENKFPEAQFPQGRRNDPELAKQSEAEGPSPQRGLEKVDSKDAVHYGGRAEDCRISQQLTIELIAHQQRWIPLKKKLHFNLQ